MSAWPMAQAFCYYTQMAPTTYTVNVRMDVTVLRAFLKEKGYRFFPAYLYLVTRAIEKQQELRMAVKDGVLGYWETLTPAYPQFHEVDKTTSLYFLYPLVYLSEFSASQPWHQGLLCSQL